MAHLIAHNRETSSLIPFSTCLELDLGERQTPPVTAIILVQYADGKQTEPKLAAVQFESVARLRRTARKTLEYGTRTGSEVLEQDLDPHELEAQVRGYQSLIRMTRGPEMCVGTFLTDPLLPLTPSMAFAAKLYQLVLLDKRAEEFGKALDAAYERSKEAFDLRTLSGWRRRLTGSSITSCVFLDGMTEETFREGPLKPLSEQKVEKPTLYARFSETGWEFGNLTPRA